MTGADLIVRQRTAGVVLFAHGSGSSRHSLRNKYVAALRTVKAPALLIVGGEDAGVIGLNQQAYAELGCVKQLAIVPGATHLFEEPGTLEEVARLAAEWFTRHLGAQEAG
jgi:pimeloyl-ACP methyl ester carboxylesterase